MPAALSLRKMFWLLFVGFVLFFVMTNPVEAGNIVRNIAADLSAFFVSMAKSFSQFLQTTFG